jgi:hypothetical protein
VVLRSPVCAIGPGGGECEIFDVTEPLIACHVIGATDRSDEAVPCDEPFGPGPKVFRPEPASLVSITPFRASSQRSPASALQ